MTPITSTQPENSNSYYDNNPNYIGQFGGYSEASTNINPINKLTELRNRYPSTQPTQPTPNLPLNFVQNGTEQYNQVVGLTRANMENNENLNNIQQPPAGGLNPAFNPTFSNQPSQPIDPSAFAQRNIYNNSTNNLPPSSPEINNQINNINPNQVTPPPINNFPTTANNIVPLVNRKDGVKTEAKENEGENPESIAKIISEITPTKNNISTFQEKLNIYRRKQHNQTR